MSDQERTVSVVDTADRSAAVDHNMLADRLTRVERDILAIV